MTVYRLAAGLPGGWMTEVATYDDLSGECLTDAHTALRAGLVVSIEPETIDADYWGALEPLADLPFLPRYAAAVLAHRFMTPADREWLIGKGLIQQVGAAADTSADI
jgi:hypothetical protein